MASARKPGLLEDVERWLATLADTDMLAASLDDTVIPSDTETTAKLGRSTDQGARAVALLHEVSNLAPTSAAQLRRGEVIAQGGMGIIRSGYQVSLGRTVAVKTLRSDRVGKRGAIDLLREAWITGAVEHPNVVPIHHVGIDEDGQPIIVLKRVEGVEWSSLVGDAETVHRRFGATDLLAWNLGILMQLLNALRFAHARGIVHRDLKPANVMIGEFGEVYLLDWGIAVSLREDDMGRLPLASRATELAGTPVYMAPEMLGRDGGGSITERTDVYLAGSVLYEIVAGRPPHEGTTVLAVIASVIESQPKLPPETPAELARICARAMQPNPDDRFASVEEMRLALVAYLEHRGSSRLLDVANARLAGLLALLERADKTDDEIYRLFGACRFGFHEALAVWRGNSDATSGLVRATTAVAEYELATGDPGAAVALLSELEDPPGELLARAREAAADHAARIDEADHLRRQHDVVAGSRTRTLIMGVMGTLFTLLPLTAAVTGEGATFPFARTHATHIAYSAAFFVIILGFGFWARESLMKTVLNRRTFLSIETLFLSQILLISAAWRLGIPLVITEILIMFVWVMASGFYALAVDRRLAPGAVGYLAAFALAVWRPEWRYPIMAVANGLYSVQAMVHWRRAIRT